MDIKKLIEGEVTFEFYRAGNLYYRTGNGELLFTVPIEDTGEATFLVKDKGILFMRYIRKTLTLMEETKDEIALKEFE